MFLGLAVLFFMGLVVASIAGRPVPDNARWLTCIVLALTASIGSGFWAAQLPPGTN
jgi:cytochrome c biogenesis protein CcdA